MINKFGLVLGVAAVATLSGCLDPKYNDRVEKAINGEATTIAEPAPDTTDTVVTPVSDTNPGEEVTVIAVDDTPVKVDAVDPKADTAVAPKADDKAAEVKVDETAAPKADEELTTVYIVQRGDYLAKISKKYNVKIDAIKKLNPEIKADNVVRIGQKIKLPGKIEVGEQTVPAGAFKATAPAAKEYKPYEGATKEYVVKAGDTLGAIAYGNGINICQLKEMNALSSNNIRVGQKLKIPAEKVVKAAPAPVVKAAAPVVEKKAEAPVVEETKSESKVEQILTPVDETVTTVTETATDAAKTVAATAEEGPTHIVKEGEDVLGLSILYSLDPAEIRTLNNLSENENTLKPGQVIKLPADASL